MLPNIMYGEIAEIMRMLTEVRKPHSVQVLTGVGILVCDMALVRIQITPEETLYISGLRDFLQKIRHMR